MSILSEDVKQQCMRDLTEENASFMWFQLLIKILIDMEHTDDLKNEMINICRKQYIKNQPVTKQIEEFSIKHSPNEALEWYSKDIFLYRLLNRALRTGNIDIIYKFRFFIHDLHFQLDELHRHYQDSMSNEERITTVFRRTRMTINEIETFKKNHDKLISVNTFFSTSKSSSVACEFATGGSTDNPGVIFTIEIDNDINDQPFATFENLSNFTQEEEVLFSIGTIFRITSVGKLIDTFWSIELTLDSKDNLEIKTLMNSLTEEFVETPTLMDLGNVLFYIGDYQKAEKYNRKLLEQPLPNDDSTSLVYNNLGDVYLHKGNYTIASEYYEKALSNALI